MKYLIYLIIFLFLTTTNSHAISNLDSVVNNKVGINSLSPEEDLDDISQLVNTNGDWGWVVVVITKEERNVDRWQALFNKLADKRIIPIVRIATVFNSLGYWEKPASEDALSWAKFLDSLYWPTKYRYIQLYNEVNRAAEWGGEVSASEYALELVKTTKILKEHDENFFILNAPLDLSLINSRNSLNARDYYLQMDNFVGGIFDMIDGFASHSYPNPEFSQPPIFAGQTTLAGYLWEMDLISEMVDTENLPIFITETGWKRSINLTEEKISDYYKVAFENIWNDRRVVVVAPFVLNYPEDLFYQFSFVDKKSQEKKYFDYFKVIRDLPKIVGSPERENTLFLLGEKFDSDVVTNRDSLVKLKFKNAGNYIWDTRKDFELSFKSSNVILKSTSWSSEKIYPGQEATVELVVNSSSDGINKLEVTFLNDESVLAKQDYFLNSTKLLNHLILKMGSSIDSAKKVK